MQGGGSPGVPIAGSEVHTHSKVDLTTTHDVVEEGVYPSCLWMWCIIGVFHCTYVYGRMYIVQLWNILSESRLGSTIAVVGMFHCRYA